MGTNVTYHWVCGIEDGGTHGSEGETSPGTGGRPTYHWVCGIKDGSTHGGEHETPQVRAVLTTACVA